MPFAYIIHTYCMNTCSYSYLHIREGNFFLDRREVCLNYMLYVHKDQKLNQRKMLFVLLELPVT